MRIAPHPSLLALGVTMSVPDFRFVPQKLYATGLYNLKNPDQAEAFTDAVVATLNGLDENFRHLKKSTSQTHVHRHGEDSVVYLLPDNKALAVDFIGGANGPNPQPGWNVGEHVYTHADAHDPDDHGLEHAAPPPAPVARIPSYGELGDDAFFRAMIGVPLEADMIAAGQRLNDGSAVWFSRATYRLMKALIESNGKPVDVAGEVRIVRNEWRALLGLAPV
jgi:hypothetical protein